VCVGIEDSLRLAAAGRVHRDRLDAKDRDKVAAGGKPADAVLAAIVGLGEARAARCAGPAACFDGDDDVDRGIAKRVRDAARDRRSSC